MKIRLSLLLSFSFFLAACSGSSSPIDISEVETLLEKAPFSVQEIDPIPERGEMVEDFDKIIDSLKKQSHIPNITGAELEKGWYFSNKNEKKYATPSSWIYEEGLGTELGRWIHPDLKKQEGIAGQEEQCTQTAGNYLRSCNELESGTKCQHIAQSTCQCPQGSAWIPQEGCLQVDQDDTFIQIQAEELEQGYYPGLNSEKKKGTPASWFWDAEQKHWQSPFYHSNASS